MSFDMMHMPGPCVVCGGTNYTLSCGGPTICPKCDCGNFDAATVEKQAKVIAELRQERDDLKSDYLRRHKDACDYWMALTLIRKYSDENLGPSRSSLLNKIAKLCDDALGPPLPSDAPVGKS